MQSEQLELSESILTAQREADEEADRRELEVSEDAPLPMVPKLLQLPQADLVQKTKELRATGNQLDLLLLKAESYSHFILENQKRSQIKLSTMKEPPLEISSTTKKGNSKRKSKDPSPIPSKKSRLDNDEEAGTSFIQPPNMVGGTLLPYQLDGVQWLLSLWENGISGILADEMGLAGPLATLPNWVNEFKKWLPSCPVIMYHGSKAEREELRKKRMPLSSHKDMNFPVVITSFEICMIDRQYLERYTWQYLILDEGHRIKNRNCRLVKELKSIRSVSRLLLTGTPIQNTLEELWSLLNFCSPMIFDDLQVFQAWFGFRNIGRETQVDDIIGEEQQKRVVTKLHEILRPFLLRRMKRDVMITMPPKREIVVYCSMSSLQRDYYARVKDGDIRSTLMAMGIEGAKDVSHDNMMMNLRKVANHPFLFGEPTDENGKYLGEVNPKLLVMASGKFKVLDRMLFKLKAGGHKVLIFSQMTKLLNILEDMIINLGHQYCRLDGSTKVVDRQEAIDRFNNDPDVFVFLLSTRAGGLGINLTAADTCILFDSDWNPHQDSQAQDRCHRIGQSRPVLVYRLLTAGSVEIGMMEKQISKKKLERLTIYGGDYRKAGERASSSMTLASLRKLLEDDVKNLGRMTAGVTAASAAATAAYEEAHQSAGGGKRGRRSECGEVEKATTAAPAATVIQFADISDEELDVIMDRDCLFVPIQASDMSGHNAVAAAGGGGGGGGGDGGAAGDAGGSSGVEAIGDSSLGSSSSKSSSDKIEGKSNSSTSSLCVSMASDEDNGGEPREGDIADIESAERRQKEEALAAIHSRIIGGSHVRYELAPSVPMEGVMYDIISAEQQAGVLLSINA